MGIFSLRNLLIGLIVIYVLLRLIRRFFLSGGKCPKKYMKGFEDKTVVITGGSSGIGLAAAKEYVKCNARKVIICSRNEKRGRVSEKKLEDLAKELRKGTEVEYVRMDLGSLESVEEAAKVLEDVDVLILNAAVLTPSERRVSKDGIELMCSVGFVGHFHLVQLLYDNFSKRDVRVIATIGGQEMMPKRVPKVDDMFSKMEDVGLLEVFGLAKTCLMLLLKQLDRKFKEDGSSSSAYYLHPGVMESSMGAADQKVPLWLKLLKTLIMGPLGRLLGKTEEEICQTHLYLTFAPKKELTGGGFYVDCKEVESLDFFKSEENAESVWELGNQIIERVKE